MIDTHGHQIGDEVLQEFSQRLTDSLRPYDIVARYGGEEFMLLLPDTDIETAVTIAEKLRIKIAQPVFDVETSPRLEVTASFGVTSIKGTDIDTSYIMEQELEKLAHKFMIDSVIILQAYLPQIIDGVAADLRLKLDEKYKEAILNGENNN